MGLKTGQDGADLSRKRRQFLTKELELEIDNIRSLPDYKRSDVMRRGREVLEETLERLKDDMEVLLWFINMPEDYTHIYRHDFGSRLEAVMPHGPPQRELSQWQASTTKAYVDKWSQAVKFVDVRLDDIRENIRMMGLFYQLRNP